MSGAGRVRALALHAGYRCQGSGACCTSGWEIPIEPDTEARLRAALRSGRLRVPAAAGDRAAAGSGSPGLPHGVLGRDACGRCLFLETVGGNRCAIHRQLGEDALPSACRHFPRVVRLTPRGVDVTLSHYCPTVARRLFADLPPAGSGQASAAPDPLLQIVEDPPALPRSWPYQGLDARDAVPPLLRPGVLMSWEGHGAWESHAVAVMADAPTPEAALDRLGADAERLRAWTPRHGDFDRYLERELARSEELAAGLARLAAQDPQARGEGETTSLAAWDEVAATVPAAAALAWGARGSGAGPARTAERCGRGAALVAAGWPLFHVPIRRWLGAKAFASWLALQGQGLRTVVLGLRVALGVLRVETLRGCAEAERALDQELLREAFRRADLLLVHLADPDALARRLSRCER